MTSTVDNSGLYRRCVGISLFNQAGQVFLGHRAGTNGMFGWQMPQGGIDADETPMAAAIRELSEETGVTKAALLAEAPEWLSYDLPDDARKASWRGRYRGQTQKWFAFRFEGDDRDINILSPAGGHKAEFDRWRWADLAQTPALVIPFKRSVYEDVVKIFAGFTNST